MADVKALGAKIAANAPTLGALLGSFVPGLGNIAGGAIGMGIKALAGAFGLKEDAPPDEIAAAIETDPQAAVKIRLAEMDYASQQSQREMEERLKNRDQDIESFKVQLADVQNARARDIETIKAGKVNYTAKILEWLITLGFLATLGIRLFVHIPPDQMENVGLLLGAEITAFITVVTYEFGTSMSSARKTELLAQAPAIPPAAANMRATANDVMVTKR